MSAFMVSDKTLRKVLLGMTPEFDERADAKEILFTKLWRMNYDAVNELYGSVPEEKVKAAAQPSRFRYDFQHMRCDGVDKVAVVKAMNCYLYQCSEGDICETPLFLAVKARMNDILLEIVAETPAYRNAPWNDE